MIEDLAPLGPRISRTKSGLPRLILAHHRSEIRKGNTLVMKYYLTLFSIYRDIVIPSKIKLETVTAPYKGSESIFSQMGIYISRYTNLMCTIKNHKAFEQFQMKKTDLRGDLGSLRDSKLQPELGWGPKDETGKYKISRVYQVLNTFSPFPISRSSPLVVRTNSINEVSTHPKVLVRSLL